MGSCSSVKNGKLYFKASDDHTVKGVFKCLCVNVDTEVIQNPSAEGFNI